MAGINDTILSVSVVIPTHNRKDLLVRAIQSVILQIYPILEINVVSDASTDGTDDVMQRICKQYSIVNYHKYDIPRGGNYARNIGISMSRGDYVAFLDDDDVWHPDKIAKQALLLSSDNEIGLVCTGVNRIFDGNKITPYIPNAPYNCDKEILLRNCIGSTTTVVVKRALFDDCGLFDEELPALQDYDMWVRLCQATKVGVVRESCVDYYNSTINRQVSQITNNYIIATEMINKKYENLITLLSDSENRYRMSNFNMSLSKRGMRNGQKWIAIEYAWKALISKPRKASIVCFFAAFVPYKISLRIQRLIGNNELI